MTLNFDFHNVKTTEFGVGRDDGDGQAFTFVTVDGDVQLALREMAQATWTAMQALTKTPAKYEASEKHAGHEHVYLPIGDELAVRMHELHTANNLLTDGTALAQPEQIFCYFARLTDEKGRRLTALRRATQFKGVLKSRLIRLVSDALKIVDDKLFKLDLDFDLLVDMHKLHILRPSGFEFASELQQAVLAAVPKNVALIQQDLTFVEFSVIENYASKHPRAARYIASIRAQEETKNIDKSLLKKLCKSTGVEIKESNGKISVDEGHVMGFLEVMDRRRYELELVKGAPEQYKAASRSRMQNKDGGAQ